MINLELGGGRNPMKNRNPKYFDYISLDIIDFPTVDLRCDLRKGIPYPDNFVDNIFTQEFLEHLYSDEVTRILKDCFRVLKIDGTLSIQCPNFRGCAELFLQNKYIDYVTHGILGVGMDRYDYHRSLLYPELIIKELKKIGFPVVKDISDEKMEELKLDPWWVKKLSDLEIPPEDYIKIKIWVRAIR